MYYASKHVKVRNQEQRSKVAKEVALMASLDHPRIVRLFEAFQGEGEVVMVLELLAGGELFDLVATEEFQLTEAQCRGFLRQICQGVHYLHGEGVMHLDLKAT